MEASRELYSDEGESDESKTEPTNISRDLSDSLKLYVNQVQDELLTPGEERQLARLKDEGDEEAKKELVEKNLRLVMSIARRYTHFNVPLMDLIQQGNIGLLLAGRKDRF